MDWAEPIAVLVAFEQQRPCKLRTIAPGDKRRKHRWEFWQHEPILSLTTGEFRDGTVLRCADCHTWFELEVGEVPCAGDPGDPVHGA